ncbi:MAG: ABC transporter ATP-binding protein [Mesorhizobium sp.]|nr:MAG: ABC transporter ATP-binding protein [Mesorhizobium sp.]
MADVTLRQVKKSYGNLNILHGIDLDIKSGEFIVFVGPSGCGKSTLLRSIAGLEEITSGELKIAGEVVNDVPPSKRGIAMVFQSYALYPHMTVYDNMAFSMKIGKESKAEIDKRVRQAAEILQLTKYLDRLPKAMSGGQRQRVAIGRAIVRNPKVFLFDEPLSNLDAALRVATHDQVEAMTLADRIVVLKDGHIEQVGTPMELYKKPGNLFVAQFIGSPKMNILPLFGGQPITHNSSVPATAASVGVRPEHLSLVAPSNTALRGKVRLAEYTGAVTLIHVELDGGQTCLAIHNQGIAPEIGAEVGLKTAPEHLHFFDNEGRTV